MARRKRHADADAAAVDREQELHRRFAAVRREVLQRVPLDDPAAVRHHGRLAALGVGCSLEARVASYEQLLEDVGLDAGEGHGGA